MVISCDSHFIEPFDFYYNELPERKKSTAPRLIQLDGILQWTDSFMIVPVETSVCCFKNDSDVSFRGGSEVWNKVSNLSNRITYQDQDNIQKEVLLPDGGLIWRIRDNETREMCFDIYNEHASNVETSYQDRYVMPRVIESCSPEEMKKKLKRQLDQKKSSNAFVIDLGFMNRAISEKGYENVFEMLNESKATIILHANGFQSQSNFRYPYSAKTTLFCVNAMSLLIDCYMRGFFDKYKSISLFFAEVGYKWLEHLYDKVPFYLKRYSSLENMETISRSFDNVVKSQLYFGFTNDLPCDFFLEKYQDSLVFGSDFPHADSSFGSTATHKAKIEKTSEKLCKKVFTENAVRLLSL